MVVGGGGGWWWLVVVVVEGCEPASPSEFENLFFYNL
jgi:hypothetical protein